MCDVPGERPELVVLRGALQTGSRKIHARPVTALAKLLVPRGEVCVSCEINGLVIVGT